MESITPEDATEHLASPRRGAAAAEAQFAPGTMVAERYRIVALLGAGGMGEVYRADDVKLGQRVALKYIPPRIASDPAAIERLYNEVRIGRQISHPNVCRLHDIIEVEGQRFISMEYVDGEDLASLLRRIGRLPADKALALTRDLCAGLAAAHDRGFIHRDLKPANVMIDGRGSARITDFGLAALADEGTRDFTGTPLYMAPEQLNHGTATVRSDLYALGLVLYEMFTGRRVFDASTTTQLREQHALAKSRPGSLVRELDPAVERVILRCLEEDPAARPASVQEIVAMLPGGDPLQAAIAAGQTPSPELVAAAGRVGGLEPARAWTMLVLFLIALVAAAVVRERGSVTARLAEIKSPDALIDDARSAMRVFGYAEKPADWAGVFLRNSDYVNKYRRARPRAETLPPMAAPFLYRDSPQLLLPRNPLGLLRRDDPPISEPGMTAVVLDAAGKLRELRRVPPRQADPSGASPDWAGAFRAAGLDPARFREAPPRWTPPVASDRRFAWTGADGNVPLRVEAAALAGRPVWFAVLDPWSAPLTGSNPAPAHALAMVTLVVFLVAAFFARRNVRSGRGDTRGALRVGLFGVAATFAGSMLVAHHTAAPTSEWNLVVTTGGFSLFYGVFGWLCYLAIEPFVRRQWPQMLVGWTRLLSGRPRDPLVGTEALAGLVAGAAGAAVSALTALALARFTSPQNDLVSTPALHVGGTVGLMLDALAIAVLYGFGWVLLLVFFRRLLRSELAAWIALTLVVLFTATTPAEPLVSMAVAAGSILATVLALRYAGVLAAVVSIAVFMLVRWTPFTFSPEVWTIGRSTVVLVVLAAAAVWAFYVALAGKPAFGVGVVEDEAPA